MDINATYQKMLGKSALILVAQDYGDAIDPEDMIELAQAVSDLDEWIRKGGFLPDAWKPKEAPCKP